MTNDETSNTPDTPSSPDSMPSGAMAHDDVDVDVAAAGESLIGNREKNPNFRWYVVHTYSMFEEKARSTLLDRIKMNKLEAKFGDIVVPKTSHDTTLKSGKKKKVERNAFPGYIIVEMEMGEDTNHLVRDTPKITGFVGNARNPRPITDQEVLRLTSPETVKEQTKQQAATQSFEKGETVKVIDGAFTNFDGVVEAVQADKMKLRILVSIFGRETPVELDYGQVQKLT
jgi:transcriptional antiterminator NusG